MMPHHYVDLTGKSLLLTGASSGIGQACALLASRLGANLLLVTRAEERMRETLSLLPAEATSRVLEMDLSDPVRIDKVLPSALKDFGALDGFVHCAGLSLTRSLHATTDHKVTELVNVNLVSSYLLVKAATRRSTFSDSGGGVVLVSSVMASSGARGKSLYGLTKGGLNGVARSLSVELAPRRIRVNTVSPGVVVTPMSMGAAYQAEAEWKATVEEAHPLGLGQPADVANACIFLVSDQSSWVTGIDFVVDGGYSAA